MKSNVLIILYQFFIELPLPDVNFNNVPHLSLLLLHKACKELGKSFFRSKYIYRLPLGI